jgi:phosphohistidine phosphatase SixA
MIRRMRKEYASLRRRPLLAPVWIAALAGILVIGLAFWLVSAASTTMVFVTRHAEKASTPPDDPLLSPAGDARALELAQHFGRAPKGQGLDAIIVSEFRRTQETVRPLVNKLGIPMIVVPSTNPAHTAERALNDYRGGRILIVGHSNTVPDIVKELSGEDVGAMSEAEYGIVYVVAVPRFSRGAVTRFDLP